MFEEATKLQHINFGKTYFWVVSIKFLVDMLKKNCWEFIFLKTINIWLVPIQIDFW